jgi:mono/diheme cytochrome c family protein
LNHTLSGSPHFIDVIQATVAARPDRAEEKDVRNVLLGAVLMLVILLLSALAVMRLGLMPVNADGTHSSLEARIMPLVLHTSIVRHAPANTNPVSVNEENLKAGASTYKEMCARCHSTPGDSPSGYGQSFYPPAPLLLGGMSNYTDSQLFWTIKHGIRNTGMLAWGSMLSDDEIWQLVSLLKNSQDLPPSVESEWQAPKGRTRP